MSGAPQEGVSGSLAGIPCDSIEIGPIVYNVTAILGPTLDALVRAWSSSTELPLRGFRDPASRRRYQAAPLSLATPTQGPAGQQELVSFEALPSALTRSD